MCSVCAEAVLLSHQDALLSDPVLFVHYTSAQLGKHICLPWPNSWCCPGERPSHQYMDDARCKLCTFKDALTSWVLCSQDMGFTGCLASLPCLLTTDCVVLRLQDIEITGCTLFVNPYKEMEEEEKRKAEAARKKASALLWQPPSCLPSCRGVPLH